MIFVQKNRKLLHKHFDQIALSQLKKDHQKLIPELKQLLPCVEINIVSDDEDERKFDAGQNYDDLEGLCRLFVC